MRMFRCFSIFLLIFSISQLIFSERSSAKRIERANDFSNAKNGKISFAGFVENSTIDYHFAPPEMGAPVVVKKPIDGGIRESIPGKFEAKYQKWKDELLSTEFGRRQWEEYAANKNFVLTINVSNEGGQGAGTGKYQWDEAGTLVGATIMLGDKIDKGYPSPIYFPVMNSLSLDAPPMVNGDILAAAKFAHEFGHVNQTARTNNELFQRQNKLIPAYNSILLKNGYNTNDRQLIDLVEQMGGTPLKIWEDREYWGERNAMNYLSERINRENFYCTVLKRFKDNINLYARDFSERFNDILDANSAPAECRK